MGFLNTNKEGLLTEDDWNDDISEKKPKVFTNNRTVSVIGDVKESEDVSSDLLNSMLEDINNESEEERKKRDELNKQKELIRKKEEEKERKQNILNHRAEVSKKEEEERRIWEKNIEKLKELEESEEKSKKPSIFGRFLSSKKEEKTVEAKEKPKPKSAQIKPNISKPQPKRETNADHAGDWEYIATHDELTGLKNVHAFTDISKKLENRPVGIAFFDINDLKKVNDSLGHDKGNILITESAKVLSEIFGDTVYRVGGDEFIVLILSGRLSDIEPILKDGCALVKSKMEELTKESKEHLTFSISCGYEIGAGSNIDELKNAADKKMYADKKAYKENQKKAPVPSYEEHLSKAERQMRENIIANHKRAQEDKTERIMHEIEERQDEINCIFLASPDFDYLYIFFDVSNFIELCEQTENTIDYSYLYVLYDGGPQYYGTDDYFTKVSHIFEGLSEILFTGRFSEKYIRKIKGIGTFKQIIVDDPDYYEN